MNRQKRALALVLTICAALFVSSRRTPAATAYEPMTTVVRAGLYYGTNALVSANLQNAVGNGYEFGYFDANRNFVSVGAYTNESKITMLRDTNLNYSSSSSGYSKVDVPSSSADIGCFHIQLPGAYSTYDAAKSAANNYPGATYAFVKYESGTFVVLVGDYPSRTAAQNAIDSAPSLLSGAAIESGTGDTVAVAATGSGQLLFEFESGSSRPLAVRPRADGGKALTWFKGYRYYGAFQYARIGGGNLTVVNFVSVEDYTKGILPYEMGSGFPIEALKAQAVCARTYAMSKLGAHSSNGFDMCATEHCQVYRGDGAASDTTNRAVDETAGIYLTYDGALCETYYSSSDGGATEDIENVWTATHGYLRGVTDPYEATVEGQISNYRWTVSYTPAELTARLKSRGYSCSTIVSAKVTQSTRTGNVYSVTFKDSSGKTLTFSKGDVLRSVFGIPSIHFTLDGTRPGGAASGGIRIQVPGGAPAAPDGDIYAMGKSGSAALLTRGELYVATGSGAVESVDASQSAQQESPKSDANGLVNGKIVFTGAGRGHNVGMSQWGAYSMAKHHGKTFEEMDEMAAKSLAGCGGLIFLPYLFGERCPYSDANARGVLFGLNGNSTPGDVSRAVLEGVAFGCRDMFNLVADFTNMNELYITGG
ncbi:MAG: SpoIID/LytB domain-containing protein, partial [Oscillospiraceae bacterium]|nr:SpoIID/LytB domain-containing protein [Oscillospiraceae bacterium]